MKRRNHIIKPFYLALFVFGLFSCAGGKDTGTLFEKEVPFTISTVYYQDWVAGVKEGGSGTNVHITIDSYAEAVDILDIYFRNKKENAKNTPQNIDQYVGYFKNDMRPNVIMDGEIIKEAQNTAPEGFLFNLAEDEAVLSYRHENEVKYVKLSQMERKPMLAYPSVNTNNEEH